MGWGWGLGGRGEGHQLLRGVSGPGGIAVCQAKCALDAINTPYREHASCAPGWSSATCPDSTSVSRTGCRSAHSGTEIKALEVDTHLILIRIMSVPWIQVRIHRLDLQPLEWIRLGALVGRRRWHGWRRRRRLGRLQPRRQR